MAEKRYRNRTTSICEIEAKDEYRFCYGVYNLVNLRKEKFEPGKSYHILSDGKVDMLNHLRWLIMLYGRIEHVCISSWSISATNILLLERWHDDGELGSVDLVVGDIFPAKFREEWSALLRLREGGGAENALHRQDSCEADTCRSRQWGAHCGGEQREREHEPPLRAERCQRFAGIA